MKLLQDLAETVASADFVQNVGWLLIHSLWQCMLIALVAICIARAMRSSSTRYWMFSLALSLMVIAPVVTMLVVPQKNDVSAVDDHSLELASAELNDDLRPIEGDGEKSILLVASEELEPVAVFENSDATPASVLVTESIATSWSDSIKAVLNPWLPTIVAVWCCGVLLFSVRPIWGWLMVRRLLREGTSPVATHVQETLRRVCEKTQVRRRVEVLASSLVGSPIVVGCFRSVILVPASFVANLPIAQLEAILAHELAHVRRYDFLVNLLQTLVETFFFYHPAVWWLSDRIRVERENCCDDLVVAVLNNKVEYGRALLAVEKYRRLAATSLALSASGGSLLARVKRLLADASCNPQRGSFAWITLGVLFMGLAVTVWIVTTANADEDIALDENAGSKTFVAQVVDETSVELLAVLSHSGDDKTPWKPNGHAFDVAPELPAWHDTANRFKEGSRNLFFRWKGLDRSVGLAYRLPGGRLFLSPDESGIARIVAEPADEGNVVTVSVGITDATWGPWQKVGKDGKVIELANIPPACRNAYDTIKPDHIEDRVNSCLFCWTGLKGVDSSAQFDLVAVTTDGQRQKYSGRSAWDGPGGTESAEVFNIPLTKIDHFEYQLRPYRHWVTFENVSLTPGKKTDVKISVETVTNVKSASRAGRFQITEDTELEITQKTFHAADVMTSGVIRLKGDKDHPRDVPLSIAMDHFANRERWKAVWEEGQPVLWYAKGQGDGPGRILPPGTRVKIEELRRIDFSNPDCIVHHAFSGWVADQLPSVEIRAALEEEFEIKPDGHENHRYYESARHGLQPNESSRLMFVWVGENGKCEVQNLAWAPLSDESEHLKCDLNTLPETLALVLKKYRAKTNPDVPIYAFVTSRPDLPAGDLETVLNACRENGLKTPVNLIAEGRKLSGEVDDQATPDGLRRAAHLTNTPAWLRFCPGTQIVEHTDAQFVSGVVVDEVGSPIAGCRVEHPGLVGPETDDQGRFQYKQSTPHRTVLRAYHPEYRLWHGAPELGDVVRIVLQKKPKVEAVNGTREMTVRVIDSRTAEPVPDVKVTASRYEIGQNGTVAATAVTNQDGTVVMRGLDFIQHRLLLSADQPVSYIGSLAHPSADEHEVVMLVDRACELVLRAVDSETGKGIAGVVFERENAAGERWQQSIDPDILGGRHVQQSTITDADGYFRCLVSSYPWSYIIQKYPEGYDSIVPIDGRQEVEIETPVGGKVEYTFRLVESRSQTNANGAAGARTKQQIVAAWTQRARDVEHSRLSWTENRIYPRGELISPNQAQPPADDFTVQWKKSLVISGDKCRVEGVGKTWLDRIGDFAPFEFTAVRNGTGSSLHHFPGQPESLGYSTPSLVGLCDVTYRPAMLGMNPADPEFGRIRLDDYHVEPDQVDIDGRMCLKLVRKDGRNVDTHVFLDPNRQFVVTRTVGLEGGQIARSFDLSYRQDERGVWYPAAWRLEIMNGTDSGRGFHITVVSTRFESQYDADPRSFAIEYPDGTQFHNLGKLDRRVAEKAD